MTELLAKRDTKRAAYWLERGEVVVFPTETVYALGANALSGQACARVYRAKGRNTDNPLIVHLSSRAHLKYYARTIPSYLFPLIQRYMPGPLTVVLPKAHSIPDIVTAGQSTVALRVPRHPVARRLLRQCRFPLAAPSANISGGVSATTAAMAYHALQGRVRAVLDGGRTAVGIESTIIVPTTRGVSIVRPGAVEASDIRRLLPSTLEVSTAEAHQGLPATPGSRHPHYQPSATLILFGYGDWQKLLDLVHTPPSPTPAHTTRGLIISRRTLSQVVSAARASLLLGGSRPHPAPPRLARLAVRWVLTFKDNREYARRLFYALSALDALRCTTIYAELPNDTQHCAAALHDRLTRAASTEDTQR